ncbi:MAG: cytochrome b561/polyisoprenoid-binding protein YceI [bacterium]|jgi:cytochrome b561/polyisoprenoid-binding protein YceI
MGRSTPLRYGDTAIIFHWLIAFLIIGLLAIGKFMTGLEENDPVRFALTQWHKSFGIAVLLLSVLRLLWRFTHKPPPEPASLPTWQKHVSGLVHLALYALMLALPITGWIMVSASPLNLDTVLFGVIPWPHIPPFPDLPNKESIAAAFHDYHEFAGTALIVLLLAHIGAALKHHLFDKDTILLRMLPNWASAAFKSRIATALTLLMAAAGTLFWINASQGGAPILAAGESEVSFIADVTGEATAGIFTSSTVVATLDETNPANSTISATVITASITSENYQVAGSLPDADWFDVENHPEAIFQSSSVEAGVNGELLVTGDLTIKGLTQSVTFTMILSTEDERRIARGSFPIDRREFSMGLESQATADYVGFEVQIKFRFEILVSDG